MVVELCSTEVLFLKVYDASRRPKGENLLTSVLCRTDEGVDAETVSNEHFFPHLLSDALSPFFCTFDE